MRLFSNTDLKGVNLGILSLLNLKMANFVTPLCEPTQCLSCRSPVEGLQQLCS